MYWRTGMVCLALSGLALFGEETRAEAVQRIKEAARVFNEINSAPDKGIPQEILQRAKCIGIVPGMKRAGFVVGGQYGVGIVTCRLSTGAWSGPATVRLEGGSFGLQIGAGETDVVFVVMNEQGMNKLLQDKFTIGAGAAAMAGPVGRSATADTDAMMHAQILSYSRSRGIFAGATLNGSTLRPDNDSNTAIYGREVANRDILYGKVRRPAVAQPLYASLHKYMPARTKEASR